MAHEEEGFIGEKLNEWKRTPRTVQWLLISVALTGAFSTFYVYRRNAERDALLSTKKIEAREQQEAEKLTGRKNLQVTTLPESRRNQGLEEVMARQGAVEAKLDQVLMQNRAGTTASAPARVSGPANNDPLPSGNAPPPVSFANDSGTPLPPPRSAAGGDSLPVFNPTPAVPTKVEPAAPKHIYTPPAKIEAIESEVGTQKKQIVLPTHTAIDAVMLNGINARPAGSVGGAAGRPQAANDVGAPFVTKIKGAAILPNGWRLDDLGDCFLGGSGIGVPNAERAYAVATSVSCISEDGEVWEASVKAYAVDADGVQGIAGKVVNKAGSVLMQSALTGMVSGLGAAFTPTLNQPVFNLSGQSESQFPSPSTIGQTMVGRGFNNAATQLSRFYLEYARETFPVVEVSPLTRVTWVLKEPLILKRTGKVNS